MLQSEAPLPPFKSSPLIIRIQIIGADWAVGAEGALGSKEVMGAEGAFGSKRAMGAEGAEGAEEDEGAAIYIVLKG